MKVIKVICLCAEQGKDLDDFFQSTAGTFISLLFLPFGVCLACLLKKSGLK